MPLNWGKRGRCPPLDIPLPAIARHPQTLVDARELESWLAGLPAASPRRQALALQRQLGFLVRDPDPPRHLGRLLPLFHPAVAELQRAGRECIDIGSLLLSPEQRTLLETLPGLFEELASAHMRAARLAIDAGRRPELADLYNAMLLLARLVQWNLLQHQQLRPGLWRQLVQLQQVADWLRTPHRAVSSLLATADDARDCNGLFRGTLLLLLADSYRQPRHCTEALLRALPRLAEELRLVPAGRQVRGIPLELSGERLPLDFARRPHGARATHHLAVTRLLARLPELLPEDACGLRRWLEGDLRALLEGRRERRYPRETSSQGYRAIVGLEAVHARLLALQQGQGALIPPPPEDAIPCRQNDISVGGASFILSAETLPPRCGEWLLFEAEARPGSGFVAGMRRRLVDDNGYQYIGVERLAGHVIPVTLGDARRPGILHAQPQRSEFRLLAPAGHFRGTGTVETLVGSHRDYRVRQLELLSRRDVGEVIRVVLLA